MGLRFRKSFKIAPGVRLNIGKKGVTSISAGVKGARVSVGKKGTRTTISAPGTGLSYSSYKPHAQKTNKSVEKQDYSKLSSGDVVVGIIVALVIFAGFVWLVG